MAEIGEEGMPRSDGEGDGRIIQGVVDGGMVDDDSAGQTGDELVCEPDTVGGAEGVAGAITVELPKALEVAVLLPLGDRKEVAERGDGTSGGRDGVEGAEIQKGDSFGIGQLERGQVGIDTGRQGGQEGVLVGFLRTVAGGGVWWKFLKGRAEAVAEAETGY